MRQTHRTIYCTGTLDRNQPTALDWLFYLVLENTRPSDLVKSCCLYLFGLVYSCHSCMLWISSIQIDRSEQIDTIIRFIISLPRPTKESDHVLR
jgi:hypothetical protein